MLTLSCSPVCPSRTGGYPSWTTRYAFPFPINLPHKTHLFFSQSHITFELYERNYGRGKTDKEYSIKLSLSEGAHSSNVLDSALDSRHSLNVQPRRKLTQHLPYSDVIAKLSKHFHRLEMACRLISVRLMLLSLPFLSLFMIMQVWTVS